jgi:MinD-like ATPase involved in chromosome partitioning or flagellar assembly
MAAVVVTVLSPRGRINLRLPDDLPVNELLTQIVAACGLPYAEWVLAPHGGDPLPLSRSLRDSHVLDGSILELRQPVPASADETVRAAEERAPEERREEASPPPAVDEQPPPLSRSGLFPPPAPAEMDGGPDAAPSPAPAAPAPVPAPVPAPAPAPAAPAPAPPPGRFAQEEFVKRQQAAPRAGLARLLYRATGGAVNLGSRPAVLRQERLVSLARNPLADPPARVAMASAKGGVGKTTITLLTASQLGLLRNDRVIAVECNPHHGTCRSRVPTYHNRSIKDLLDTVNGLERPTDLTRSMLSRYTTQVAESRLEVLTAPTDPAMLRALGEIDYRSVLALLDRYFDIVTMDLGTGLLDPVTQVILGLLSDQVVVVVPAALDGAELGVHTLKFITARRGAEWVKQHAIVVINQVRRDTLLDVGAMERHFMQWVRACVRIRWDRHLEAGGILSWEAMDAGTRDDFLVLAAELGQGFSMSSS